MRKWSQKAGRRSIAAAVVIVIALVTAAAVPAISAALREGAVSSGASATRQASRNAATPPSSSGFPDASNTGVPAGTVLARYTGPCTITSAQTINAVDALSSCGELLIRARGVVITNSLLPRIDATDWQNSEVTISDSTVDGGTFSNGAIWGYNITATRVNVIGGNHSFQCASNCVLIDSWLHDQYNAPGQANHIDAFLSNGGSNMIVRGNTIHCTALMNSAGGGCTGDLALFGDFEPIDNVLVENNLFKANNNSISYCVYGGYQPGKRYPVATNVRFVNNVFERGPNRRCGVYGPVTSFQTTAAGNVWSGNRWDDGTVLDP